MPLIDPVLLKARLGALAGRFDVTVLDECDSTNSELLRRADCGAPDGTVIVADCQTAGRGRRGRQWLSAPADGLTFSLLWRFSGPSGQLAGLSLAEVRDYPFPRGDDPSRFVGLRQRAEALRRDTPYAVVGGISGVVYEICWYMRGLERWFMDMIEQPDFCEALLDQTLKFWLDWFDVFLAEVGDGQEALHIVLLP